ncbi:hypothetical protein F5Y16DRAFT_423019 [Xylariaceae sp. FL0255]|nr:hypothetical protein F5Y16DRAFT_423019 [Xylariaceae sp. FL0255]
MRRLILGAALVLGAGVNLVGADRPPGSSLCDYYAEQKYQSNTSESQYMFMRDIVSLAFGGGGTSVNATNASTGILNPGVYNGAYIDLISWFDGSKATTNQDGEPLSVNYMDSGAQDPLIEYLNGSTSAPEFRPGSNEERLFVHFYSGFGYIFQCSLVTDFPKTNVTPAADVSVAYTHKFMDLNQTDLAHFIDQVTLASQVFGVSESDAEGLSNDLNGRYNNRCSPPDSNGMLNSLCLDPSCPLPLGRDTDCAAYDNIPPNGTVSTGSSGSSGGGSSISKGAIAGIVIAAVVVVLLAIALFLYFRRKHANDAREKEAAAAAEQQRQAETQQVQSTSPGLWSESGGYPSPMGPQSHLSYTPTLANTHNSYGPYDSYLGPGGLYLAKHADAELAGPPPVSPHVSEMESPLHYNQHGSPLPAEVEGSPFPYSERQEKNPIEHHEGNGN